MYLVLNTGEVLPGHLLEAQSGGPVRWATAPGKSLQIDPGTVAGVHFLHAADHPRAPAKIGLVEFRDGDRLRGDAQSISAKELVFQNAILGKLTLDRSRASRLFPQGSWAPQDLTDCLRSNDGAPLTAAWRIGATEGMCLDGNYVFAPPPIPEPDGRLDERPACRVSTNLGHPPDHYALSFRRHA